MTPFNFLRATSLLALLTLGALSSGCQTQPSPKSPSRIQPAESIEMIPQRDVRELRATLPGKSMREVVRIMGQPKEVFTLDAQESWRYENAVRDSVTGKPVKYLEVLFVKRKVNSVNFGY